MVQAPRRSRALACGCETMMAQGPTSSPPFSPRPRYRTWIPSSLDHHHYHHYTCARWLTMLIKVKTLTGELQNWDTSAGGSWALDLSREEGS